MTCETVRITDATLTINKALHYHVWQAESLRSMCGEDMGLTDEQFDLLLHDHDVAVDSLHAGIAALEGHVFADYVLNLARTKAIRAVGNIGEAA